MKIGISTTNVSSELTKFTDQLPNLEITNCYIYLILDRSKFPNLDSILNILNKRYKLYKSAEFVSKDEVEFIISNDDFEDNLDTIIRIPGDWQINIETLEITDQERLKEVLNLFKEG